jgi:CheY-like chemotaxis protein
MTASKQTILYAEDDLDDLDMVKLAFEKHNEIQIIHASDGNQALNHLHNMLPAKSLPCLIILDINMPGMDGRQALLQIKATEAFQHIPVVMFTTSNSPMDMEFAKKHGADFVTKPLRFEEIENLAADFTRRCNFESNARL